MRPVFAYEATMSRSFLKGFLLVVGASVLWGAMGAVVQYVFSVPSGFTALGLVTLRQLSAGVLFVAAASCFMPRAVWRIFKEPKTVLDIALSGCLIFGGHYGFFQSIYYSNAGTGAVLLTLVPLLAAVWNAVRHHRFVSPVEAACFVLAATGVALIVTDGDFGKLKFSPLAIGWGLVAALFSTAYLIQPVAVIRRVGVIPVTAWGILTGGLIASVFCHPWTMDIHWTLPVAASFAFIVVFGTVVAFYCYMSGLKYMSPVVMGLLNCAEPLSAFLFSILFLGDRFGIWQCAGVAMVLANVCLLTLAPQRR